MKPRIIFTCILALLLIPLNASAKNPITWAPKAVTETMGLMDSDTVSVVLSSNKDLGQVELWVVPELQPFISVSPTTLTIQAGHSYTIEVTCTVPSGTETRLYDGTIHIKRGKKTIPATFKVELDIFAAAAEVSPLGGTVEVKDPASELFGVELNIPEGACSETTSITIDEPLSPPPIPEGFTTGDYLIELQPHGLTFYEPVQLTFPANGLTEKMFYVYNDQDNSWHALDTSLSQDNNAFIVIMSHFTIVSDVKNRECGTDVDCPTFKFCEIVTYKINSDLVENAPDSTPGQIKTAIENAIGTWEDVLGHKIKFEETNEDAEVEFYWEKNWIDADFIKAQTIIDNLPSGIKVKFNDSEEHTFSAIIKSEGIDNIEEIALHEMGHVLGLIHKCIESYIPDDTPFLFCRLNVCCRRCDQYYNPVMANFMSPIGGPICKDLKADDKSRIKNLYEVNVSCPDSDFDNSPDYLDCEPNDDSIYPGAPEICWDSIDQDCDREIDGGCPLSTQYTFTKVVDVETYIPNGTGKFIELGNPSLFGDKVAFRGVESGGQGGIYLYNIREDQLEVVANENTIAPGGTSNFTQFEGDPSNQTEILPSTVPILISRVFIIILMAFLMLSPIPALQFPEAMVTSFFLFVVIPPYTKIM